MYQKRLTQIQRIYYLLQDRKELGVHCYEFADLLHITQQNARVWGLRKQLGCICKNTDTVLSNCLAKQHIINKNDTTYLIEDEQPTETPKAVNIKPVVTSEPFQPSLI